MPILPSNNMHEVLFETRLVGGSGGPAKRGMLRLGNRITCGVPVAYDLVASLRASGQTIPYELKTQLDAYEFLLLRLVCTFHPAADSEIRWADFKVRLQHHTGELSPDSVILGKTVSSDAGISAPEGLPVAYDVYPKEVWDKEEVNHSVELSPNLKFQGVGLSIGKYALTVSYERLQPRIRAFGELEPEVYWRYEPGTGNKVGEGIKEMDLIVRKERGTVVQGTIRIEAQGRRWGIVPAPAESDQRPFYF